MHASNPPMKLTHVMHPDDELFDAVDIHIIEEWHESELTGKEWRFRYVANVKRKGKIIVQFYAPSFSLLLLGLQWRIMMATEEDGTYNANALEQTEGLCDQPGCSNKPVIFYSMAKMYREHGTEVVINEDGGELHVYRQFCENHVTRGDRNLDDSDQNYSPIPEQNGGS